MDSHSRKRRDLEHSRLLQSRIETSLLAAKIGADAASSQAAKTRAHSQALSAERDLLHKQLGEKIAEKASEIQKKNPAVNMAQAYRQAAHQLGLS